MGLCLNLLVLILGWENLLAFLIVNSTKLKTEKVKKIVKIEKYIFKTKASDSFSLAPMERAPQKYPKKMC